MDAHVLDDNPFENMIFGKNSWVDLKVFNMMKICNIDENSSLWWKSITVIGNLSIW